MASPQLDLINVVTTKRIMPGTTDNYFKNGPIMAYLRRNRVTPWTGGTQIQENFLYRGLKPAAYAKGGTFDISHRQILAGGRFAPKYYYVPVSMLMEDVEVELKGPTAVLNYVDTYMQAAALSMSAKLEIAIIKHGQNAGTDRTLEINGLEEALNDGSNASYSGQTFTSYGLQPRADVNGALTPPTGLIAANAASPPTYRVLEHSYTSCCIADEHPTLGVTTKRLLAGIGEQFAPQQRATMDTKDPVIGWPGVKFRDATIVASDYMPGADGVADADLGSYYNATETFLWLNFGPDNSENAYMRLHLSNSPLYSFGFTGFKPAQDSTSVAGQVLFCGNFTVRQVRLNRFLFGLTV